MPTTGGEVAMRASDLPLIDERIDETHVIIQNAASVISAIYMAGVVNIKIHDVARFIGEFLANSQLCLDCESNFILYANGVVAYIAEIARGLLIFIVSAIV